MNKHILSVLGVGALSLSMATSAQALTLNVVQSMAMGGNQAFGVAYDGANVWVSGYDNILRQVNQTSMTLTGTSINQGRWSADAWDGSHFLTASGGTIFRINPDGTSAGSFALSGGFGGLIDGLGFDMPRNELWFSPDVSTVSVSKNGGADPLQQIIGGSGGFSGVEPVDVVGSSFLIVVNDAFQPRKLCKTSLTGVFDSNLDCAQLPNARYEDLAFDGRYLYAADFYGNRLDKIDLLGEGGSIFVPPNGGNVPEPFSLALFGIGIGALAAVRRNKKQ